MIINNTQPEYEGFPDSLNGEVLLNTDISSGIQTATLATCYLMSKLTAQQRIDNGWSQYETLLATLDFTPLTAGEIVSAYKIKKEKEMNRAYKDAEAAPIVFNAVSYYGGRNSAASIKESLDITELAGLTDVDVYDINDAPQVLSIADAKALILAIANTAKTNLFKFNAKVNAIKAATTEAELDGVVW